MSIVKRERNLNIDILKAFAILSVVLYHLGSNILPFGYLGVDIFFVISGFFIMKSMQRAYENCGKYYYWRNLFSRLIRLWPPILVVTLVSLLLGFFLMLPDDFENLSQSVIASNVFANNILACVTTKNYWDVVNQYKPLMHLWYAGVLMQAYVVIPLLLMLVFRFCKTENHRRIGVAVLLGVSFVIFLLPIASDAQKFYYLPFRLFEFFAGALIALLPGRSWHPNHKPQKACVWILSVVLLVLCCAREQIVSAHVMLVTTVFCASILMAFMVNGKQYNCRPMRLLAKIGKASLSIYLWHQVLVAYMYYGVTQTLSALWFVVFGAATALVSAVSYFCLEVPLGSIRHPKVIRNVLIVSVVLCGMLCAVALFGYIRAGVVRNVPELGITTSNVQRGMHSQYNDRVYKWDKDFKEDSRVKVLVFGDSFGRDFANILSESSISKNIQISYIYLPKETDALQKYKQRIEKADLIFFSPSGDFEHLPEWLTQWSSEDRIYIVGTKNFGTSNGLIYSRRFTSGYLSTTIEIDKSFIARNQRQKAQYKDHYIDLLEHVTDDSGMVRVFTEDGRFISQDCRHLTQFGAEFFAAKLELSWILE